ncbi:hypothetical protein BGW80DRAFT_1141562, partial [Lactifluus volemus]
RATTDPEYENRIQEAISGIVSRKYKTIVAAATANSVSRQTLSDRLNGKHQSIKSCSHARRVLSDTVEAILVDWARTRAASGTPYKFKDILNKVFSITGQYPRRQWVYRFLNKDYYRQHSDNLELVTGLECGNAAGTMMKPYFVLKDGPLPNPLEDSPYGASIIIIAFPSKTTHKLQPLDVGVFGCLQKKWYVHADNCLARGLRIDRYNVIQEYCLVRDIMIPSLVQKAFEHTGIYPLNPNLFSEQDFAPSFASSTVARSHLPSSYPSEVLTS